MSQEPTTSPASAATQDARDLASLKLGRKLWLARFALAWERAWPALWPALGIGGCFVALGLFDVLPVLPAWLHGAVLAAFTGAIGAALWRGLRAFRFPGVPPAKRRIEKTSGYLHRPLTLANDRIAGDGSDAQTPRSGTFTANACWRVSVRCASAFRRRAWRGSIRWRCAGR